MSDKYYYKDGSILDYHDSNKQLHRIDGPAIDWIGGKHWYINGLLHRENGPAIEYEDGDKCWYINDRLHRTDGPAIEWFDNIKRWYVDDVELTEEEFNKLTSYTMKDLYHYKDGCTLNYCDIDRVLHNIGGPAIEFANGDKWWYINGIVHRTDGPAIKCIDGTEWWYINGKLHRANGPAVKFANGSKEWYIDDKLHRLDGPAIECISNYKEWYINGKELTEEQFNNHPKVQHYKFQLLLEEVLSER